MSNTCTNDKEFPQWVSSTQKKRIAITKTKTTRTKNNKLKNMFQLSGIEFHFELNM